MNTMEMGDRERWPAIPTPLHSESISGGSAMGNEEAKAATQLRLPATQSKD